MATLGSLTRLRSSCDDVEETDEATLRDTMETMFFGPARLTKAVLPRMRSTSRGAIVQMSSVGGFITAPGFSAYCAAKHALEAYSEALAAEVSEHGLRVLRAQNAFV